MLPVGLPLLDESRHALLLVLQGEHGVENASLKSKPLLQVQLLVQQSDTVSHFKK